MFQRKLESHESEGANELSWVTEPRKEKSDVWLTCLILYVFLGIISATGVAQSEAYSDAIGVIAKFLINLF